MKIFYTIVLFLLQYNLWSQTASTILDGSLSTGVDTYRWRQISGKASQLNTPDSVKCKVTGLTVGKYEYELTVSSSSDSRVGNLLDSVIVYVISGTLSITPDSISNRINRMKSVQIRVLQYTNSMIIQIVSPKPQIITYEIYDVTGRKLKSESLRVRDGPNDFNVPLYLQRGLYFLRFSNYFDTFTRKIIVL